LAGKVKGELQKANGKKKTAKGKGEKF